jgi:hypothetical protein
MKITADGTFALPTNGASTIIYVAGTLGGGTLEVGYNIGPTFYPYTAITLTVGGQFIVDHGEGMTIQIKLAGSTTPATIVQGHTLR